MPLPHAVTATDISESFTVGSSHAPSLFGQTINDLAPMMGGSADGGCLVLVSIGGAVFGAIANHAGEWSLDTGVDVPLSGRFDLGADGRKVLLVIALDSHGRSCAVRGEFTVLTAPPEIPTLVTMRVFRHWPLLDGRAEPASRVTIVFAGATYMVIATRCGAWSLDTAAQPVVSGCLDLTEDGGKEVVMISTDAAGNTSSGKGMLVLDTSIDMSCLAVVPVPRSPEREWGGLLLADVSRIWRTALGTRRVGGQRQHRR